MNHSKTKAYIIVPAVMISAIAIVALAFFTYKIATKKHKDCIKTNTLKNIESAIKHDTPEYLKRIIKKEKLDIKNITVFSQNLLFASVSSGALRIFRYLLEKQIFSIDEKDHEGNNILSAFTSHNALKNFKPLIKIAIKYGGMDINLKDCFGRNILWVLFNNEYNNNHMRKNIIFLLDMKIKIEPDNNGASILASSKINYWACYNPFPFILNKMLDCNLDPTHTLLDFLSSKTLEMLQIISIIDQFYEGVALVLQKNPDLNMALMFAEEHLEFVKKGYEPPFKEDEPPFILIKAIDLIRNCHNNFPDPSQNIKLDPICDQSHLHQNL